jgi:hypothetical protein
MIIFKRKLMAGYNSDKKTFYEYIDRDAGSAIEDSKENRITKKILKDIALLYSSSDITMEELSKKAPLLEYAAMNVSLATEISNYFSRICSHISHHYKKNWEVLLRRELGELTPDIIIAERKTSQKDKLSLEKIKAVIELRPQEWIRAFIVGKGENCWGWQIEKTDICSVESRAYFQKYVTTLGVSLSDIFVILPTLSVSPQDSIKTITELQECFSQNTGIPAENLVILSENRFLQESGLTTHFEKFLQKLLEK